MNNIFTRWIFILISLVILSDQINVADAADKPSTSGIFDFNLYPYLSDADNDTFFTLNIAAKFEDRFTYFGFINLSDDNGQYDADRYYSEQSIQWKINEDSPLDLTLQLNFRTGHHNNRQRLGIRWRLNDTSWMEDFFKSINLRYTINLHAIQFDHQDADIWQLEHAFMMRFPGISEKLYLAGFMDHTFNEDLPSIFPDAPIVGEAQLGYEVLDNLFIILEYRVNEYRRSQVSNVAAGIEYKVFW